MDNSTFSALRIVAVMIGVDGKAHPRETRWFLSLAGHYGVLKEQRQILREDIEGQPDVAEIFSEITNADDREKLLTWLRRVVAEDGDVGPEERALLARVEGLNAGIDQKALTDALLAHDRNVHMWKALGEAGKMADWHVSPWHVKRHMWGYNLDLITSNRKAFWFVVIFFLILVVMRMFFRWPSGLPMRHLMGF